MVDVAKTMSSALDEFFTKVGEALGLPQSHFQALRVASLRGAMGMMIIHSLGVTPEAIDRVQKDYDELLVGLQAKELSPETRKLLDLSVELDRELRASCVMIHDVAKPLADNVEAMVKVIHEYRDANRDKIDFGIVAPFARED